MVKNGTHGYNMIRVPYRMVKFFKFKFWKYFHPKNPCATKLGQLVYILTIVFGKHK